MRMKTIFAAAPVLALPLAWWVVDVPVVHSAAPAQHLTAPVEEGELRRIVSTTGTLNAIVNVEVGSQLSGQVAELLVDFNDEVRKGQPLARLDQRSFQARVTEAHAAMEVAHVAIEVAKSKLERARIDAEDARAQRPVLDARIDSARVKLEAARSELRRKEVLRERSIGTTVDVEDAQTKVRSAEAALREAQAIANAQENKVEGAKADVERVRSELDTAVATLPQKRALLEVAKIDLDRTTIRAPIDGVIVGRNVNEGQTLATTLEAKTLFTVAGDLKQMEIHAKVDEADIGKVLVGQDGDLYGRRSSGPSVRRDRPPGAQGAAGCTERRHLRRDALRSEH